MINRSIYKRLLFVATIAVSMVILSCATVVKPTGGPKDNTPPKMESAFPTDSTVNFNAKKIVLEFNEFVKLNNPRTQVLMNPFMGEDVDITARGKKIIIKLPDSLDDAGTYHIFFGNAVQDITEGNTSTNLHYVFSTGSYLDSCSISGYAIDALENKVNKDAWLILHKAYTDIKDTIPVYLAHANEKGEFVFSNLKPGTYYAFALVDANSDYKFSLANEPIGFYPDPIELSPENHKTDSIRIRIFENADTVQKKIKTEMFRFRTVRTGFKQSLKNPSLTFTKGENPVYEWDDNKDTITFWIADRSQDSLKCIITDGAFRDTIVQNMNAKLRFNKALTDTTVKILSNIQSGKLLHFDTLRVKFLVPISQVDTSKIMVVSGIDTVNYKIEKYDSLGKEWAVIFSFEPGVSGNMVCDSGAFTNLFGHANDSTTIKWQSTSEDDFGSIILTLGTPPSYPFIVQINSGEGTDEQYLQAWTDTITFEKLLPGAYSVKIIVDKNKDGVFTTGDFDSKRQPEPVYTLPRPVAVRQGFESRTYWSL